jgi:putative membrane protein
MSFRHKIFTLGVLAVAALPADAVSAAPPEPASTHHTAAVARPASPEAEFLIAAHQGNLAQIAAGRLAVAKSPNRTVRKLGKRFTSYHKRLDSQVRKVAAASGVRLPKEPSSEQLALVTRYRTAPAAEFDALFVETQLAAYEHAAKLARLVLKITADPAIIEIVESAAPVIEQNRVALTSARSQLLQEQPRQ